MTNDDFAKRQISAPPHREDFFSRGEFIYDPDDPWPLPRSGMIVYREDKWLITLAPRSISEEWFTAPLVDHKGQIGRHILIDHSGLGIQRGPAIDPSPWMAIRSATLAMLRDADKRRLLLDDLRKSLLETTGLDPDLVDDTLRMMASMGCAKATSASCGIWYGLSSSVNDSFDRKDYLGTFSDELLAKSQRIDFLIRHTGTVGSYREAVTGSLLANTSISFKVSPRCACRATISL